MHAKNLRKNPTDAEQKMWQQLRNRRLAGHKFRRQHPIPPYFVDFVCLEKSLVVEIDGSQHLEQETADRFRTAYLEQNGYGVLRFWNHEVLCHTDKVVEQILRYLDRPSPQPSPPPGARGKDRVSAE